MVHRLQNAANTNGDSPQDVSAAVSAVLQDVEEYLVSNLKELERAGANGKRQSPDIPA